MFSGAFETALECGSRCKVLATFKLRIGRQV